MESREFFEIQWDILLENFSGGDLLKFLNRQGIKIISHLSLTVKTISRSMIFL